MVHIFCVLFKYFISLVLKKRIHRIDVDSHKKLYLRKLTALQLPNELDVLVLSIL